MKTGTSALLLILIFIFNACKKEKKALSEPVKFTETTYTTLSSYDSSGKPNNLLAPDQVSSNLLSFISSTLPGQKDLRTTHPELLTSTAIADIDITQQSDIYLTFVSQLTAHTAAIGFYTYPTNQVPSSAKDIKTITYVFPNAGLGTTLQSGDKVKIGRFSPGTTVGFVLMHDAWTTERTLNNDVVHFCSNDILNPEVDPNLKKHAVLVNYDPENKVLIGFEDIDRTSPECDNDFDDVIIYATVTP